VVAADGGEARQVTSGESRKEADLDPSWSPDGASLAFGTWPKPAFGQTIYVVNLKTNHVSSLPGSEDMWSPRWSPDGLSIAGLSRMGWTLMLYDLRTRKQTRLCNL